mmetsp:Transcript_39592/g.112908  ORF Transcript_39592/g.112908 Transcript_39592/m.112908 type:complete len:176 (-) Transcript_39592:2549-3076(-)
MVVDTGTSFITMPKKQLMDFLSAWVPDDLGGDCGVSSGGAITCRCSVVGQLSPVSIIIGGRVYVLYPENLFLELGGGHSFAGIEIGDSMCQLEMSSSDQASAPWILGDVFLRRYYTIFRLSDEPAVGFAEKLSLSYDDSPPMPVLSKASPPSRWRESVLVSSVCVAAALLAVAMR